MKLKASRVKQELWILKNIICLDREELSKERWEREVITQLLSEHIYSWATLQRLEEPKHHEEKSTKEKSSKNCQVTTDQSVPFFSERARAATLKY